MRIALLLTSMTAIAVHSEAQTCSKPQFPGPATAIDASSCTNVGNDADETNQNTAKNNFCPFSGGDAPQSMQISDFVKLQQQVEKDQSIPFGNRDTHPISAMAGPATDRAPLVALGEGNLAVLQGFVNMAKYEQKESVNCAGHVPDTSLYHDIHVSIADKAGDAQCTGVVAEMIPRHRPKAWTPTVLEAVAKAKLPVRVTGQLMFDSSHTPCQSGAAVTGDPARVSLWEIHPIYEFEVCPSGACASGGWVKIEAWKP